MMNCLRTALSLTVGLLLLACPDPALAWGREGHLIVAQIAQAHLTPSAARAVGDLLHLENCTRLDLVANWAEEIRSRRRETASWHYVDIPLQARQYDAVRDCGNDDCVVGQIRLSTAVLADRGKTARERLEALKWLTHLVADVHQPLRTIDNGDRGGADILVANISGGTSLYRLWESDMIEADDPDAGAFARRVDMIGPEQVKAMQTGSPEDWANESHRLAVAAYAALGNPAADSRIEVPPSYFRAQRPVIEGQLEKAGLRLAMTLNSVLK